MNTQKTPKYVVLHNNPIKHPKNTHFGPESHLTPKKLPKNTHLATPVVLVGEVAKGGKGPTEEEEDIAVVEEPWRKRAVR